jgi:hypothetical protein
MRHLPFVVAVLLIGQTACIAFNFGSKKSSGDAGASDAGTSDATSDRTSSTAPQGIDCGPDPYTGVVLCSAISSCPNIYVDYDLYPGCGFRVHGSVLDLECACYGQLCPIGVTSSCDEAAKLLANQSAYAVCAQINEGRCTSQ